MNRNLDLDTLCAVMVHCREEYDKYADKYKEYHDAHDRDVANTYADVWTWCYKQSWKV